MLKFVGKIMWKVEIFLIQVITSRYCEVLFSPGLSVCLSVCVCVCICVSDQYFGILFLGY